MPQTQEVLKRRLDPDTDDEHILPSAFLPHEDEQEFVAQDEPLVRVIKIRTHNNV